MPEFVTIKVTLDTRTMLRLIAAHTDRDIYEVAENLAWNEMKRKRIEAADVLKRITKRLTLKRRKDGEKV